MVLNTSSTKKCTVKNLCPHQKVPDTLRPLFLVEPKQAVCEGTLVLEISLIPQIVGEEFLPLWDHTLSNEEYHADKTAVSSTWLKEILKSPKAFLAHGQVQKKETAAFRIGRAVHMAILEPEVFQKNYVISPEFKGTGSVKLKADWRMSLPDSALILKEEEYEDLLGMINSVSKHGDACNILKNGKAEISGYFRDPITGIKCRIRPDFWHREMGAIMDVKTTISVKIEDFSKAIWNYRYDFQTAMYSHGIKQLEGMGVGYPLFLAIEKKPPYEVAVYCADDALLQNGYFDYQDAMGKLKTCISDNFWPGYQYDTVFNREKMQMISLPKWAERTQVIQEY